MSLPSAHRTIVKSAPELWAELSDAQALARHLGEFGEIRITRLEHEAAVAWEGDRGRGTVALEPSGWGTKVTLTAQVLAEEAASAPEQEEAAPAPDHPAPEEEADAAAAVEAAGSLPEPAPEPDTSATAPDRPGAGSSEPAPAAGGIESPATPEAAAVQTEPNGGEDTGDTPPRRGFLARFLDRVRAWSALPPIDAPAVQPSHAQDEPADEPAALEPPVAPEPDEAADDDLDATGEATTLEAPLTSGTTETALEPASQFVTESTSESVIEPVAPEAGGPLDPERVQAILVAVLDDLGTAHHRPYSRA